MMVKLGDGVTLKTPRSQRVGGVNKGMRPEGWPRILFRLAGNVSLSEEAMLQRPKMSTKHRDFVPSWTSLGKTSPALPAKTQGGSVKSARGGITLRVGVGECWYYEGS